MYTHNLTSLIHSAKTQMFRPLPSSRGNLAKTNRASRATRALEKRGGAAQPGPDRRCVALAAPTDLRGAGSQCCQCHQVLSSTRHRIMCRAIRAISAIRTRRGRCTCTCVPIRAARAVRPPGLGTRQPWCWCSAAVRAISACNWCGTIRDSDSALTDSVPMTEHLLEMRTPRRCFPS
jgi:hypothetical protein